MSTIPRKEIYVLALFNLSSTVLDQRFSLAIFPLDDFGKRSAHSTSLQFLMRSLQDQPQAQRSVYGTRYRRLQPSEFLGKRTEILEAKLVKRPNEFLGKRSDRRRNKYNVSEFLGKRHQ